MMRSMLWMCSALALAGCDNHAQTSQRAAKLVIAEPAPSRSDRDSRVYAAVARARIEAVQSFRVGGRIAARLVDVGDRVRLGQVLATLDATDWALNAEALRGQLAAATAQRDNARADLARFRELTAQKLMSKAELDRQEHAVAAAEGQVAALTAQASEAANKLGYTELRADADGVVTKVMAEPGQVVSEGAPILVVARAGELEVEFSVPEQRLGGVRPGQAIQFSLWSEPETWLDARIREIAPAADPATRAFRVRATLLRPPPTVGLGMTANVRLGVLDRASTTVSLPVAAVFDRDGAKTVWLVDPAAGTLRPTPVEIGGLEGNRYLVTAGVRPGELVVTAGVHRLNAGDRVAVYAGGEQPTRSASDR